MSRKLKPSPRRSPSEARRVVARSHQPEPRHSELGRRPDCRPQQSACAKGSSPRVAIFAAGSHARSPPCAGFNRLGEFPSELPNDLPLSPTAEAFYRSGPAFWQRYTSFWLASLLNRIVFFIIPIAAMLIPLIGALPRLYRWLNIRRIDQLHRALGNLEREHAQRADKSRLGEYRARIAEIESAVRLLKVARPFEADLQRLRIHLRMVQDGIGRTEAVAG